mmetsp:Transcript_12010/g.30796  ORF Transcript_12010/g.30796 Transcript_12010/m.30796 type:complete len:258 (+) Transcript_12010:1118-1891(+)
MTWTMAGCGLPRMRLDRAHTALRSGPICPIDAVASISLTILSLAPLASTRSRMLAQSPAMLPMAQTACSQTSMLGEVRRLTRAGTPLLLTTASHCLLVPEAMLVRHHAASNCSFESGWPSIVTNEGTRPALMTSSMGGLRASESCLRRPRVALKASSNSSGGPLRCTKPSTEATICSNVLATVVSGVAGASISTSTSAIMLRRFCRPSSFFALRSSTFCCTRFLRQSSLSTPALTPRRSERSMGMVASGCECFFGYL